MQQCLVSDAWHRRSSLNLGAQNVMLITYFAGRKQVVRLFQLGKVFHVNHIVLTIVIEFWDTTLLKRQVRKLFKTE